MPEFELKTSKTTGNSRTQLQKNASGDSPGVFKERKVDQQPVSSNPGDKTSLPDGIKKSVENLSGYDMSDVKVHYNSARPEQVGAYAYTQGTEIHLGTGQEKHLPHEAWHVVQQKQGRVGEGTIHTKGLTVNDDHGLEREADKMGEKLVSGGSDRQHGDARKGGMGSAPVLQMQKKGEKKQQKAEGYHWEPSRENKQTGASIHGVSARGIPDPPTPLYAVWEVKNKWNKGYIDKFEKTILSNILKFEGSKDKFTCEDLALKAVTVFARDNALPFKWLTESGLIDASSSRYTNYPNFLNALMIISGAPDFQRAYNTLPETVDDMQPGDLMLNDHRDNSVAHHIQVATGVNKQTDQVTKGSHTTAIDIKQGNFREDGMYGWRHFGSPDPSSDKYYGTPIQTGKYDVTNDMYIRGTDTTKDFSKRKKDKLEFRRFNFMNWNG